MSGIEGEERAALRSGARWRTTLLVLTALLGAGVLIGLIAIVGAANHQRDRALALQSHSYEVMILASTLSGTIADAEATLGRYVISDDKQLGQLYGDRWQQAGDEIDRLDAVTGPRQQRLIDQLRTAYTARGDELSLIALSTVYHENPQALARYYRARKAPSLARIDALLKAIIANERELLDQHSDQVAQTLTRANMAVHVLVGFGILIVLGAILLGALTVQALGEQAVAQAEADAERERVMDLRAAVAAATAELEQEALERADAEARLRQVQKMEAVGQLTGGIAHDFNNMLAVVIGGLELTQRHLRDAPDQAARHVTNALEGANRAATLTRRLLAFSRAEPLMPEAIEPGALIAGMTNLLDRTLGDAITVATSDGCRGWRIWADRHQLENAILNLAVNARDAMDGRGTLTIAAGAVTLAAGAVGQCAAGDYATIAVTDSGCGMAPDVMERVFEPFFTTKPVGKGTGLGLSQIFGFVRQSEGEIALRSEPGCGTTVTLYLPRHTAAGGASHGPEPEAQEQPTGPPGLDILVVEDDPRVLTATLAALAELGHHAIGCGDPGCADAVVAANPTLDLIVSDVLMPGRTGPEMVAALTERYPHLAILFVTGYAGEHGGDQLAGRIVLRKPFTLAGLERAMAEAMAVPRPAATPRIAAE